MRRRWLAGLLFATVVGAAGTPASAATAWQTCVNDRFGATADVPAGWKAGDPPANDDGLSFTSPDGSATVAVYGSLAGVESLADDFRIYEEPNDGETITYRHKTKRSLTISGTAGDRIFYRKWILVCRDQVWNGISVEYPAADKLTFDPIVEHVAKSLRAGTGYQVSECR